MKIKKTKNGLKKVNWLGFTIEKLEFGRFPCPNSDVVYKARVTEGDVATSYFTDATSALICFTGTARAIFNWTP